MVLLKPKPKARRYGIGIEPPSAIDLSIISGGPALLLQMLSRVVQNGLEATGRVVSEEIGKRLFDTFIATKKRELGIGLAICRTVLEGLGSHILKYHHRVGCAEFEIALPFWKETAADEGR